MGRNPANMRKLFVTAVTLVIITNVVKIYKDKGNSTCVESANNAVFTEPHIVQSSGVQPAAQMSQADRPFDKQETLQRRLPQCIIIGAMKCGTRALIDYLALHPDIVTAPREINYFDHYFDRGLEWYRSKLPLSRQNQMTIEKTPNYFLNREAPSRIHAMNATIKIVLTVCDPVARSISDWLHYCRKHKFDIDMCRTYEGSDILTPSAQINRNSPFIRRSSYALTIEYWTRWFRLGTQLHIVDGHRLVSDPISELEKVETFLGLRHHITHKNLVFNEEKGFYCVVSDQGKEHCLGTDKGVKHPNLIPEVEAKLRSYFKPLNEHFYRVVGRDFGWP